MADNEVSLEILAPNQKGPKILVIDIETSLLEVYTFGIFDQHIPPGNIKRDWFIMAVAAKWITLGDEGWKSGDLLYRDQRGARVLENDRALCKWVWDLLDEADVIVTQNGKKFDEKKLNARFIAHGFKPYSPVKHIDTKQMASQRAGFTSNSLEYLSQKLCKKYRKSKHSKFPGVELWKECEKRNPEAWREMEDYNKADVNATGELCEILLPWANPINFAVFYNTEHPVCGCGSTEVQWRGYDYTAAGKYRRFQCKRCRKWSRGSENLFAKTKRASLLRRIPKG